MTEDIHMVDIESTSENDDYKQWLVNLVHFDMDGDWNDDQKLAFYIKNPPAATNKAVIKRWKSHPENPKCDADDQVQEQAGSIHLEFMKRYTSERTKFMRSMKAGKGAAGGSSTTTSTKGGKSKKRSAGALKKNGAIEGDTPLIIMLNLMENMSKDLQKVINQAQDRENKIHGALFRISKQQA